MQVTYDKEVDALNVVFRKGKVAKTIQVAPEVLLDVDAEENPLYLEILFVGEKIRRNQYPPEFPLKKEALTAN